MDNTWIWIIAGILLVLIIIGLIAALTRGSKAKRIERERAEAEQLRQEAAERERRTRESQAAAAATDADARAAQADADRSAANADRQAAEAEQRRVEAERIQQEAHAQGEIAEQDRLAHDEKLREADAKDPDVRTDEDGFRIDDDRDRGRGSGVGTAAAAGGAGAAAGAGATRDSGRDDLARGQDAHRDGHRDGIIESESSYADESVTRRDGVNEPGLGGAGAAGAGATGAGRSSSFDEPGSATAGSPPPVGANEPGGRHGDDFGGAPAQQGAGRDDLNEPGLGGAGAAGAGRSSFDEPGPTTAGSPPHVGANEPGGRHGDDFGSSSFDDPASTTAGTPPPMGANEPATDSTVRRTDLPSSSTDADAAQRADRLSPEERPDATEQDKGGFMKKVRGKVEELKGDDRPRH